MWLWKSFASIIVLAAVGIAVGWLWAGEEILPSFAPAPHETAAAPVSTPVEDQIPAQAGAAPVAEALVPAPNATPEVPEPPLAAMPIEPPAQAEAPQPAPAPAPAAEHTQPQPAFAPPPAAAHMQPQPVFAPPPAAEHLQPPAGTSDSGSEPGQAAAPARETPVPPAEAPEREKTARADPSEVIPPIPPYDLQTRVDERRDRMRRRRNAMLDAYGGPRRHMPPWFAAYDDAVERYRDARRSYFRSRRDLDRTRRESWMDSICPWPKPRHDWSARRSYQRQMEQLDRRELRDAFVPPPPYGFAGPAGW